MMSQAIPAIEAQTPTALQGLGQRIAATRKRLRISATAAAEAAGVSRVTLHRIEKGEPSVGMGAWASVVQALGLHLALTEPALERSFAPDLSAYLPLRIALIDYPQLRALAWQVQGVDTLTPAEALDIYERNARHLDLDALSEQERMLISALQRALGRGG